MVEYEVTTFQPPIYFNIPPTFDNINVSSLPIRDEFSIVLQQSKVENKLTQVQLNNLTGDVIEFCKRRNLFVNNESSNTLMNISNSTYLQCKLTDEVLNNKSWVQVCNHLDGEFVYIDFKKQFEFILSKEHLVQMIIENRLGNKIYFFKKDLIIIFSFYY